MTEPANKSGRTEPPWREHFAREGFVLLRRVVPPEECSRFLYESVEPALGIDEFSGERCFTGIRLHLDRPGRGDEAGDEPFRSHLVRDLCCTARDLFGIIWTSEFCFSRRSF